GCLWEEAPVAWDYRGDDLLRGLDVLDSLAVDEAGHDGRLEQREGHELRQPGLVELEARPGDDHRAGRVVDPLSEQVLAEPRLLPLEHVGERLERAVAGARHGAAA